MKTRIGILGGTFDPVHQGHIQIALEAKRQFDLKQILFVPAYSPPHKKKSAVHASFEQRYKLLELALKSYPEFKLTDIESRRKGVSYTVDTVLWLRSSQPNDELYLILGDDAWAQFASWRDPGCILKEVAILVAPRSSLNFSIKKDDKVQRLDMPLVKISSSEIRQAYQSKKQISNEWMHPAVDRYIREHNIYF